MRLSRPAALIAIVTLMLTAAEAPAQQASASAPLPAPPTPPRPPREERLMIGPGIARTAEGLWYRTAGAAPVSPLRGAAAPELASGGPDGFGYTWNDSVPFSWIDATAGTDTGMSGDGYNLATGPVSLPFSFKFYEGTYTQVWIAASGYLAFSDQDFWDTQSRIPDAAEPNAVIAPYWSPAYLSASGPAGRVFYMAGGAAPNRWFAVEWHDVAGGDPADDIGSNELYRYEVILHENGDIVFQYHTMTFVESFWCGGMGIEDSLGTDGLTYLPYCTSPPSGVTVRFYRPAPAARLKILRAAQGAFMQPGGMVQFEVGVYNIGDLGADTIDLSLTSAWPASLFDSDGTTPLADSDGDLLPDTGVIPPGGVKMIFVEIDAPGGLLVGDSAQASLTGSSSINPSVNRSATFVTAIPARFAQAFSDSADWAARLYLATPEGRSEHVIGAIGVGPGEPVVVELPGGGLLLAWIEGRCLDGGCNLYVEEIHYAIANRDGSLRRPSTNLTDHSGSAESVYDYSLAVTVAPDGKVALAWLRERYNSVSDQSNLNVLAAVLEPNGNVSAPPTLLTNNSTWASWGAMGVPFFTYPAVSFVGAGRYAVAWVQWRNEIAGEVDDIFYTVRDAELAPVVGITQFTSDTPGWDEGYYAPGLTGLSGERALLTWTRWGNGEAYFAVLNHDGGFVRAASQLTNDGYSVYDDAPDAAELTDGRILVAWTAYSDLGRIRYALLDPSTYDLLSAPIQLDNPFSAYDAGYVSVAPAPDGDGVLTWIAQPYNKRQQLFYALIEEDGSVGTQPMVFRNTQDLSGRFFINYTGHSSTSHFEWSDTFLPAVLR